MVAINKVAKNGLLKGTAMMVLLGGTALAKDITIAWNPNTEPDIAGYHLYVTEAGQTPTTLSVSTNQASVLGLVEGKTYTFYATAFNTAGLESDPSQQISYTVPGALPAQMDSPTVRAAGGMRITSRGELGHSYAIQAASELPTTNWTTLQVKQPNTSGLIIVVDPVMQQRRFYRTIEVP
jgi:hypothetical protein